MCCLVAEKESRTRAEACRAVRVSRALKQAGRAGRCGGQSSAEAGHPRWAASCCSLAKEGSRCEIPREELRAAAEAASC